MLNAIKKFVGFVVTVITLICLLITGLFIYAAVQAPEMIEAVHCAVTTDHDIAYGFCRAMN